MSEPESYYRYWGKAQPSEVVQAAFHLLPFHCLDVAAVGVAYFEQSSLLKSCCRLLNCSEQGFLSWSAFLLALHDLGKFSEAFQSQRPDLIFALQKREPNPTKIYSERHDSLGYWLWDEYLVDEVLLKIGINDSRQTQRSLKCWLSAVTGHHGMPPKPYGNLDNFFHSEDKQTTADFVQAMAGLLLTDEAKRIPTNTDEKDFQRLSEMLSWWFAGDTVFSI
jgi:CRISPR-associated endonuclease/helicase Cas3